MSRLVVVTDLDGTLLSHETYDWSAARPAVMELARRGIPLVMASSKTRAEIELWRERLGNVDPFIVENGGALCDVGGRPRVEFGTPYATLRAALAQIARELGLPLRGFGEMSREEIGRWTGLQGDDLDRAAQREYDEPFISEQALTSQDEARLRDAAAARKLRITRGGRFFHLIGENDKGMAVRRLKEIYAASEGDPVTTLGLGDSENDLEMLQAVDRPIVVARPDLSHHPRLRAELPDAHFTRAIGPAGFAEAVLDYLAHPW